MAIYLDTEVQYLKGVGPKIAQLLEKKEIYRVADLLEFFPRVYEDRRHARSISSLRPDETVSLRARIVQIHNLSLGRTRRRVVNMVVGDSSGRIVCKFFRIPFRGYFEKFEVGQEVRVVGKLTFYRGQLEFHHPNLFVDLEEQMSDQIIPIYPQTEGLTSRKLSQLILSTLESIKPSLTEAFPENLMQKYNLIPKKQALEFLHQPPQSAGTELLELKTPAHRRIIFEEFFWFQLFLATRASGFKKEKSTPIVITDEKKNELISQLPFELTNAQKKVFDEVRRDLTFGYPMHRLVQGDVGSGKTVVALLAASMAIKNGMQAALMAPTEILAEQHFKNSQNLFSKLGIRADLLTGSLTQKEWKDVQARMMSGETQLVIGTHALIQDDVRFLNLGLVIVDEQHRFGVDQRKTLKEKGKSPHFLLMTATPIPRTLAMTVYGDLDVSIINELPKGRQPIITRLGAEPQRARLYEFLSQQLQKGRQAYIVYPLVEESEKVDLKNAMEEFEKLQRIFPSARLGLLHGRMKADEKESVMESFRKGETQILVSTTVIEVGVDVPNSTVMVIEHAERFGLSQLHQLRGRVGRGKEKSYCFLMAGYALSDVAQERLQVMVDTNDGFKISEKDLEIRGAGELLGTRQSGLPGFRLADLVRDAEILQQAREAAFAIVEKDPKLIKKEHQLLREKLLKAHGPNTFGSIG